MYSQSVKRSCVYRRSLLYIIVFSDAGGAGPNILYILLYNLCEGRLGERRRVVCVMKFF